MSFGSGPKQSQETSAAAARRRTAWSEESRQYKDNKHKMSPGPGCALAGRRCLLVGQSRPHTEQQTMELRFLLSINTRPRDQQERTDRQVRICLHNRRKKMEKTLHLNI